MKKTLVFVSGVLIFAVGFLGCNTGPKLKNKKAYLNGDNYSSVVNFGMLPIAKTKAKASMIQGKVKSKGVVDLPLRGVVVLLTDKRTKSVIKETATNALGEYSFSEVLDDKDYVLIFKKSGEERVKEFTLDGYKKEIYTVYFK